MLVCPIFQLTSSSWKIWYFIISILILLVGSLVWSKILLYAAMLLGSGLGLPSTLISMRLALTGSGILSERTQGFEKILGLL